MSSNSSWFLASVTFANIWEKGTHELKGGVTIVAVARSKVRNRGTCTGEHGVGTGKMKYLEELGIEALRTMKKMRQNAEAHEDGGDGGLIVSWSLLRCGDISVLSLSTLLCKTLLKKGNRA
ncbi:hypothetical protein Nepgr_011533 [Nepenthes gracilis]|uniref:FAD-binding oxidoreductase/transferase type 4 C-terminal domain-containing protein n=1 Tax=Nepenthes gracilis TaxID=150966 RepID=A0AAD3SFN5_NEPGR|nr:hypothetical protein Nepgr_011533 [Nepenthes gracilis]